MRADFVSAADMVRRARALLQNNQSPQLDPDLGPWLARAKGAPEKIPDDQRRELEIAGVFDNVTPLELGYWLWEDACDFLRRAPYHVHAGLVREGVGAECYSGEPPRAGQPGFAEVPRGGWHPKLARWVWQQRKRFAGLRVANPTRAASLRAVPGWTELDRRGAARDALRRKLPLLLQLNETKRAGNRKRGAHARKSEDTDGEAAEREAEKKKRKKLENETRYFEKKLAKGELTAEQARLFARAREGKLTANEVAMLQDEAGGL